MADHGGRDSPLTVAAKAYRLEVSGNRAKLFHAASGGRIADLYLPSSCDPLVGEGGAPEAGWRGAACAEERDDADLADLRPTAGSGEGKKRDRTGRGAQRRFLRAP